MIRGMRKGVFAVHVNTNRSASGDIQSDQELCYSSLCSTVPKDSKGGQRRPRSDCASAQSDLGLRCSHKLADTFSHGAARVSFVYGKSKGRVEDVHVHVVICFTSPLKNCIEYFAFKLTYLH